VASSALTQKWLDWRPTQTALMDDLNHARDFEPENAKPVQLHPEPAVAVSLERNSR
jgi:hypothetical protein